MPTFAARDLEIHYELFGQGPRLLVFNGSGATIASARLLIDQLAQSFEVLVHDQRGLGLTGLPASPDSFTMTAYAADGAKLLDHVGWPTARVFGISFGDSGRYDGLAPPVNSEAIASQIEGSELRCYEGGHLFVAQDPRALGEIVEFLAG